MPISFTTLTGTAPSFDAPLEMLAACHERIEAQCATLRRLVPHVAVHGADQQARQAAEAVMRYFDLAGEAHHRDEEEDLFPALRAARGPRSLEIEALIAALLIEHARMRRAWRVELRPCLAAIAAGESAWLDAKVVEQFAVLYLSHIERENTELFSLASAVLGEDRLSTLGRAMSARRGVQVESGASQASAPEAT